MNTVKKIKETIQRGEMQSINSFHSRDPFSQPSLYSMTTSAPATAEYDFQITVFLEDSAEPIFHESFKNKAPARDGTYVTTYAVPDHRMWSRPLRVFVTDLTNYRHNSQHLLKLRLDYASTPQSRHVQSVPLDFQTREFNNADQRTIKVNLSTVYRLEMHFNF